MKKLGQKMPSLHRVGSLVLALFLLAGSVSAQDRRAPMRIPLAVLAVAGSTDLVSTFTSHGNHEDNPVVAWMNPHAGFPATVAVGAVIEVAAVWGLCKLLCDTHPRLAKTLAYTAAGLHGSMAAKNWNHRGLNARYDH